MPSFARPSGSQAISRQDFARERSESEWPSLWDGLEGFWCAGLGPTGTVLINVGPQLKDRQAAPFTNLTAAAWLPMLRDGRPSIDFFHNSSTGFIDAGLGHINESRNEITFGAYLSMDGTRSSVADWRLMARAAGVGSGSHRWMLGSSDGANMRTRMRISGAVATDVTSGTQFARGENILAAATYDGVAVKHWKNGVQIGSFAHAGTLEGNDDSEAGIRLYLGATKNGSGVYGTMDARAYCFFVYSRVLLPSEMAIMTAIPHAMLVPRPTMVSAFVAPAAITVPEIVAAATSRGNNIDEPDPEVLAY